MTTKYQDLAKAYRQEAEEIKALKKREAEVARQYNENCNTPRTTQNEQVLDSEAQKLSDELSEITHDIAAMFTGLRMDLEGEYNAVPYTKPRQQGIDKTLELLGLS